MKTGKIIWIGTIKCRLGKYRACSKHRGDEICVKTVALNRSVDCVDGRITLG